MKVLVRHKIAAIAGFLVGLIMPFVGIFAGLQISPTLGTVLAFPLILLSAITGMPFGKFPPVLLAFGFALSGLLWCAFFVAIAVGRAKRQ